jgi:hypothetical protein
MSAAVQGEARCSKPTVEVGVAHIGCAEDAAAFVALAAAVDLSMEANSGGGGDRGRRRGGAGICAALGSEWLGGLIQGVVPGIRVVISWLVGAD